jgi:hypothetical protein
VRVMQNQRAGHIDQNFTMHLTIEHGESFDVVQRSDGFQDEVIAQRFDILSGVRKQSCTFLMWRTRINKQSRHCQVDLSGYKNDGDE